MSDRQGQRQLEDTRLRDAHDLASAVERAPDLAGAVDRQPVRISILRRKGKEISASRQGAVARQIIGKNAAADRVAEIEGAIVGRECGTVADDKAMVGRKRRAVGSYTVEN